VPDELDTSALLAAYDSQLRAREEEIAGATCEWDGPLLRFSGTAGGGFVEYRDLGGLEGEALDALIARQIAFFAARGERFEWKTRGHDAPEDLPQRLVAAGFVPEERETVLIGRARGLADPSPTVEGVTIRETTAPEDFRRIATMSGQVWGEQRDWMEKMFISELPEGNLKIYLAEVDGQVVSAAWIRFVPGTEFAGLWGGSTLAEFRGRGIYKALVAVRAADAIARGYTYLQVDASDDSRPILQRLGFTAVTTTTPYIWEP
jgi:ribosomal protein S18 acetylase RimI-like enzyme